MELLFLYISTWASIYSFQRCTPLQFLKAKWKAGEENEEENRGINVKNSLRFFEPSGRFILKSYLPCPTLFLKIFGEKSADEGQCGSSPLFRFYWRSFKGPWVLSPKWHSPISSASVSVSDPLWFLLQWCVERRGRRRTVYAGGLVRHEFRESRLPASLNTQMKWLNTF